MQPVASLISTLEHGYPHGTSAAALLLSSQAPVVGTLPARHIRQPYQVATPPHHARDYSHLRTIAVRAWPLGYLAHAVRWLILLLLGSFGRPPTVQCVQPTLAMGQ